MEKTKLACPSTEKDHQCKELVIDIPDDSEPALWPKYSVYKVPENLRHLNKEIYTPQLISIGPLHHGNKKLANMEKQKLLYLREFCKRTMLTWKDFVSILEQDEELIRQCYAEKSELCSNEYVKMILLDAVFIIEFFIREHEEQEDYILDNLWLKNGIQQDLLLLENQLPYSVLNKLHESAFPSNQLLDLLLIENQLPSFALNNLYELAFPSNHPPTFHDLACNHFKSYQPKDIIVPDEKEVLHFTDLLRYFMANKHPVSLPQMSFPFQWPEEREHLFSAAKLHEAGVEFERMEKECLTFFEFDKGKLKMPRFEVSHDTERVIRNLMALEQCHYPFSAYICNCIFLMDFLINTAKDVDLLVEKEVIVHWLGSNEALADMVNKLGTNIIVGSSFFYRYICEDLKNHYKSRSHRAMKTLRSVYFANVWRGTSTIAAIILLVLTLIQTICSIIALR